MTELDRLAEIQKLANLPPLEYDRVRTEMAKRLGCRVPTLDKEVRRLRPRKVRNGFEHSNTHPDSPTDTAATGRSNGCSNEGGVRTIEDLQQSAREIIEAPDVLEVVRCAITTFGYAGDVAPVVLIYVALSSRLTNKPVNIHAQAQAASGKTYAINTAVQMMPPEGYLKLSAMSPKALIHGSDDLRHKTVVLSECDSLSNLEGNAATLVRSIIEDARTDFDVVERNPETGESVTRRIVKEGPTGLITSGLWPLEMQMGTRVLNLHLSDTPQQTREILRAEANLATGDACGPDPEVISRFVDFQRWLAAQPETRVVVPFASMLAESVPVAEVRMRRDFKQLIIVIRTIALLNQRHRARNEAGAIIADLADYKWARWLLLSSFRSIVGGGITDAVRATCEAVPKDGEVSEANLVRSLGLAKSTIHYRVGRALKGGWLINLEDRRGYAYRLTRGASQPEEASPLPTVEELEEAFERSGNSNTRSNGPQATGGVREPARPFESSNDLDGSGVYPSAPSEDEVQI